MNKNELDKNHDLLNWEKEYERNYPVEKFQEINNHWWLDCYNQIEHFILKNVPLNKNSEILECGCGSGNSSLRLAHKVEKVVLFDISINALECAKQLANYYNVNNVEFIKGDVFHIPFDEKQFDFCWNIGLIEHYNLIQAKEILKEMVRVTKHGGYICIGVPNFASLPILKARLLSFKPLKPLTFWVKGYRLTTEKKYNKKIIDRLLHAVSKEDGIKLTKITFGYVGSILPVETPEFIFRKINKFSTRFFNKFSFLILVIAQINHS